MPCGSSAQVARSEDTNSRCWTHGRERCGGRASWPWSTHPFAVDEAAIGRGRGLVVFAAPSVDAAAGWIYSLRARSLAPWQGVRGNGDVRTGPSGRSTTRPGGEIKPSQAGGECGRGGRMACYNVLNRCALRNGERIGWCQGWF
jgi:hypothetical protein